MSVTIVDNGGANMNSLIFALQRLGVKSKLSAQRQCLQEASHVILPGVGHAGDSMNKLIDTQLITCLKELTVPVLGICLGMQLLYDRSDEGNTKCLGIVSGGVSKLPGTTQFPAPHMGWNKIRFDVDHPLLTGIASGSYFYFVHSYVAPVARATMASTQYQETFSSIVMQGNYYGVQFHPERSGPLGEQLLSNFLSLS